MLPLSYPIKTLNCQLKLKGFLHGSSAEKITNNRQDLITISLTEQYMREKQMSQTRFRGNSGFQDTYHASIVGLESRITFLQARLLYCYLIIFNQ